MANSKSETTQTNTPQILIIGGGATGFYVARELIQQGFYVLMVNQDPAIGGGTRYFIRYDKEKKMKLGLLRTFMQILEDPHFMGYYGGVTVGNGKALTLDELLALNPSALVLATGSRGEKPLAIPGIDLQGVHNAYDIAQCYNHAPGYENYKLDIGKHVAILGVGNVTADIIYWLTHAKQEVVQEISVFGRRGPFEFKMKHPEVKENVDAFDPKSLVDEIQRVLKIIYVEQKELQAKGKSLPYFLDILIDSDTGGVVLDERTKEPQTNLYKLTGDLEKDVDNVLRSMLIPEEKIEFIKEVVAGKKSFEPKGPRVYFHFLTQPEELEPNGSNTLGKIHLSHNKLVLDSKSGRVKAEKIDCDFKSIPIDTFIYSIGSVIDPALGIETDNGWPKTDAKFPYRLHYKNSLLWAFGWGRRPSTGLVGAAKQDVANGIWDLITYLKESSHNPSAVKEKLEKKCQEKKISFVSKEEIVSVHRKEMETKSLMAPAQIRSFLNSIKQNLLNTNILLK